MGKKSKLNNSNKKSSKSNLYVKNHKNKEKINQNKLKDKKYIGLQKNEPTEYDFKKYQNFNINYPNSEHKFKGNVSYNTELISNLSDDNIPWISERTNKFKGLLKLHYEILDFYEYMKPTHKEIEEINIIKNDISNTILEHFKDYSISTFGSTTTGLNLPDSDIDILIYPKNKNIYSISSEEEMENERNQEIIDLSLMKKILKSKLYFSKLVLIKASIPILKAVYNNKDIDISVTHTNGIIGSQMINDILKDFPYLRQLIIIIKCYLRQHDLNSSFTGGMSSFSIFTLAYSFCLNQMNNHPFSTLGFFYFWGIYFDYTKYGISIRNGGFFFEEDYKPSFKEFFLRNKEGYNIRPIIENFQKPSQNIGNNCFKFSEILKYFQNAYYALTNDGLVYNNISEEIKDNSFIARFINISRNIKKRKIEIDSDNISY